MTEKLKPCPFCGGEAEFKEGSCYYRFVAYVKCKNCHARTMPLLFGDNGTVRQEDYSQEGREMAFEEVTKLWNRRSGNAK